MEPNNRSSSDKTDYTGERVFALVSLFHLLEQSKNMDDFSSLINSVLPFVAKRRDNLLALGEKYKGKITPEVMQQIIALPLEEGGSFRPPNFTSYQVVAEPENLKLWIRIPEYQEWTDIELAQFFNKK